LEAASGSYMEVSSELKEGASSDRMKDATAEAIPQTGLRAAPSNPYPIIEKITGTKIYASNFLTFDFATLNYFARRFFLLINTMLPANAARRSTATAMVAVMSKPV